MSASTSLASLLQQLLGENAPPLEQAEALAPESLFPFQQHVLMESGLLAGESVLCHSPTGTGKSLIADAAALAMLHGGGFVIYLASTRALVRERTADLAGRLGPFGYRVAASTRDDRSADDDILAGRVDVAVMVYEKARALLQRSPALARRTGLLVADEIHLLRDPQRGPAAEVLLRAWRRLAPDCQFVALSAQLDYAAGLARSLGMAFFESRERLVPLRHGTVNLGEGVARWEDETTGDEGQIMLPYAPDPNVPLERQLAELVDAFEKPLLIFAATRREAARLAGALAEARPRTLHHAMEEEDPLLEEFLSRGVALHTAELTRRQRRTVEEWLRAGRVEICVATTTLAEGLNFGVRTVLVFPGVMSHSADALPHLFGRAGRPGQDAGYAFLVEAAPSQLAYRCQERQPLGEKEAVRQAMEAVAFLLSLPEPAGLAGLFSLLSDAGYGETALIQAIAQGRQLGFWEGDDEASLPELTPSGRLLARGGIEPETIAGWRPLLRRFREGGEAAATAFLALGADPACRALPLSRDERVCGRWICNLLEELHADPSALARYFADFLEDGYRLPRRLHQAAKGVLLHLEASRGRTLERLAAEFSVSAGVIEEFLHHSHHLFWRLEEFARSFGVNGLELPSAPAAFESPVSAKLKSLTGQQEEISSSREPRLVICRGSTGQIRLDGHEVRLTRLQFRLLELLARQAGRGVPYERIERYVWVDAQVERQQISFHRANLEKRLGEQAGVEEPLIETHATWGLRLRLEREDVFFEEETPEPALLECPAEVVPINFIAREICL